MKLKDVYLLMYNTTQLFLWCRCATAIVLSVAFKGWQTCSAYAGSKEWAQYGQALSVLEVLHAIIGLAGGGASAAFIQVLGRSAVLFGILPFTVTAPCTVSTTLLAVWAVGDIVRYAFYISGLIRRTSKVLLWARYSLFIVLYPVGFAAEWIIYYLTLAEIDEKALHAVRLPNTWNFAFDLGAWNRGVLVSYMYFAPSMYFYMLRQRKRKLGSSRT